MKETIRLILSPVWKAWFLIWFTIPFLILYPFFYLGFRSGNLKFAFFLKKVWAACICFPSGIIPVITYQTKKYTLPAACVITPNHSSYLDICLSVFYIKHVALFMAKAELLKAPLFKSFFKYMDIPVNRKSRSDSHKAFILAGKKLDEGYGLIVYPEGTISNEGELRAFKNGAFKLAIDKQVPIIPVVNLNNWKLLQNGGFFKSFGRPGIARIMVFDPIPTTGLTEENLVALRDKTYAIINETLGKYNTGKKI